MKCPSHECHRGDKGTDGYASSSQDHYSPLVIMRQKKIKVEPLSPPSMSSDDESSMSPWSEREPSSDDEEFAQTQVNAIRASHIEAQSRLQTSARTSTPGDPETTLSDGDTESDTGDYDTEEEEEEEEEGGGEEEDDCEDETQEEQQHEGRSRARNPALISATANAPSRSSLATASTITTTTPPQTPPPPSSQETETAIHLGDNNYSQSLYRPAELTAIGRDRGKEKRLSEGQRKQLDQLIEAIKEGQLDKLRALLECQRDPGPKRNLLNVFVDGQTALHYALINGRGTAWCKLLIAHGADPNLTNRAGWHPIHLAAYNSSRDTMSYIIGCIEPEE